MSRLPYAHIHRVRGRDLVDALERAARRFGDDVLLLSREPAPGGGVTVAVGRPARLAALPRARASAADSGRSDVERALRRAGASAELVELVLAEVEHSGARGPFAIDAAAKVLAGLVARAPSPRVRRALSGGRAAHAIAFAGPAGAGKTTTLVKLAARLVRARRRVALVSTAGRRKADELEPYARLLQVPWVQAEDGRKLARLIAQARHVDAVLIDASGPAPAALAGALPAGSFDLYLTAPATADRRELEAALATLGSPGATALVLTHLDRTRAPAGALEFARAAELPIAFLCDGPEIAGHLHRPTPDRIADLFLRGKIGTVPGTVSPDSPPAILET